MRLAALALTALFCLACTESEPMRPAQPAATANVKTVAVVLFPMSAAAPLYVGVDQGFYAREGLDVKLTHTPNSAYLVEGLANGKYQLAAALVDNFIAYQENQHAVKHRPGHDLKVLMGLSTASVALVARKEIAAASSLAGREIGIDAPGTGFAFVLYHLMEQAGLQRGQYQLTLSGSTEARWEALSRGELDATLLAPEFTKQAVEQGFRSLVDSRDALPVYMGASVAADSAWIDQNRGTVEAFLRASLAARAWLARPVNIPTAARSLAQRLGGTPEQMESVLRNLLEAEVLIADGSIDSRALDTVLGLRRRYGTPPADIGAPEQYLDLSLLERARGQSQH